MSTVGVRDDLGEPRLFALVRTDDVSGVSGTGRVADGVQWPDGTVTMRWRTTKATTVGADCIEDVVEIHGHDGRTTVAWSDPDGTVVVERTCSRSFVHGSHWWVRECGTSVYDYWCPGHP